MSIFADTWLRTAALHLWQASLFGLAITLILAVLPGPARLHHFAGLLGLGNDVAKYLKYLAVIFRRLQ